MADRVDALADLLQEWDPNGYVDLSDPNTPTGSRDWAGFDVSGSRARLLDLLTPSRELADFGPDGHLLTESPSDCTGECAGHLYALAQDAEIALSRVRALCDEWETLQKGPGPTTDRIRAALRPAN